MNPGGVPYLYQSADGNVTARNSRLLVGADLRPELIPSSRTAIGDRKPRTVRQNISKRRDPQCHR